ncbi:MAG: lysoplasmalogenase [Candidatus Hydrogenedentes bacterium]|nr:lysoplasmalogenase [Candidatus Hydrogenedentota bacterium]
MEVILISLAATIAAVALLLWFIAHDHYIYGFFKMLASTGFVVLCVASGGLHSPYGGVIFAGLILAWWGDLFLISQKRSIFMMGLIAFFLAHICYCAAFIVYGIELLSTLLALCILALPALWVLPWLNPHLGRMRAAVYCYILIISVMTALAISTAAATGILLIPCGAALFYGSDIFVARDRFVAAGRVNAYIGLPLYYTGQILLALTPLYTL